MNEYRKQAWKVKNTKCINCNCEIVGCCPSDKDDADYEWFCTNQKCINYEGVDSYDDEQPDWVIDLIKNERKRNILKVLYG